MGRGGVYKDCPFRTVFERRLGRQPVRVASAHGLTVASAHGLRDLRLLYKLILSMYGTLLFI